MHCEDIRVTSIFGDPESAGRTAEQTYTPHIARSPEEMAETVDAVMVTSRRGSLHREHTAPFLEKGMPVFVDKPFTSDLEEARQLAQAIRAAGCPVMGGSGCKYTRCVQSIKDRVAGLIAEDKLLTASLNFSIMLDSVYDGFWFYASHLVEICLEIFGAEVQSVQAIRTEKSLIATLKYPKFLVSLQFVTDVWRYACTLVTQDGAEVLPIDISDCLRMEAERFARMLRGEWSGMTPEELVRPVALIDAILRAEDSGKTVELKQTDSIICK